VFVREVDDRCIVAEAERGEACSPQQRPGFAYGYLEATGGPKVSAKPHFESEGIEFALTLDSHVTALDWRGAYLNDGAP
jgi:hypothetical protein